MFRLPTRLAQDTRLASSLHLVCGHRGSVLLFAYLVNWYFKAGKAGPVMYDAGPLMYGYLLTVFVAQYVVIIGVVVAPILLVVLIVEGSRSAWSALVH